MFRLALLIAAFVCFTLATLGIANGRLIPAGLACWSLSEALAAF